MDCASFYQPNNILIEVQKVFKTTNERMRWFVYKTLGTSINYDPMFPSLPPEHVYILYLFRHVLINSEELGPEVCKDVFINELDR